MSTAAVKAGQSYVEIGVKNSLDKGLRIASSKLKAFGQSVASMGTKIAGVGSAILGPMLAATYQFASFGDRIQKQALKIGIAAEALQELRFAADHAGVATEVLDKALIKLQKGIAEAAIGSGEATKVLAELGLDPKQLKAMPVAQQMGIIADRMQSVKSQADKIRIAMKLFEEEGVGLVTMMADGSSGLAKMAEDARKFGLVLSQADVDKAAELTDALSDVKNQFKGIMMQVGAALAPVFIDILNAIKPILADVIAWVQNNRKLVQIIAMVAAVLVGVGTAMVAIGGAISTIGFALGGLAPLFKLVFSPVKLVLSAFKLLLNPMRLMGVLTNVWGVALRVGLFAIRMILSKIFLIPAAIGLVLAAWMKWTKSGQEFKASLMKVVDNIKGHFVKAWEGIKETFSTTWGGIVDAIKAGDIKLAAQIAWTGLKLAFFQAVQGIYAAWVEIQRALVHAAVWAVQKIAEAWYWLQKKWYQIKGGWNAETIVAEFQAKRDELDARRKRGEISQKDYVKERYRITKEEAAALKANREATESDVDMTQKALKEFNEYLDGFSKAVDDSFDAKIKGGEDDIKRLQDELNALRNKAALERGLKEDEKYRKHMNKPGLVEDFAEKAPSAIEYSVEAFQKFKDTKQEQVINELRKIRERLKPDIAIVEAPS
jgi:hypothetical protein